MKKAVSYILTVGLITMILSPLSAFANTPQGECSLPAEEASPRTTIETVPDYYYVLVHYNGDLTRTATVYKDILVPTGCELVSHGAELASIYMDGYYENVQYSRVARYEYQYDIVRM